jgi:DNA-binding CsgD family transcriptional regulator
MQPRDRLTVKEVQVATLVWQGLTNKDIARVLITSEQVVKNYLRTAFDKLGVWTRLELALYVAGHGGANWHAQLGSGNGLLSAGAVEWAAAAGGDAVAFADAGSNPKPEAKVASAASASTR